MEKRKKQNDASVQGTNDSSIVSKCSAAALSYFADDFLRHFVCKKARRSPLINRGYHVRARAINDILHAFLNNFGGDKNQIVSLGAGFDSAYFRLHSASALGDTSFYEVDFPQLVKRKALLIKSEPQLKEALCCPIFHDLPDNSFGVCISSDNYHLLGVDLKQTRTLHSMLEKAGLDFAVPTLLLSECVITYIDTPSADAVISWAAEAFKNGIFISYEQVIPNDPFGIVMQQHFRKLNSPLNAIQKYSTMQKHCTRYITQGWQASSAINMYQYYRHVLTAEERQRVESIELFDEFEELHLTCMHYVIVAAFNGACAEFQGEIFTGAECAEIPELPTSVCNLHQPNYIPCNTARSSSSLQRFSHTSATLPGNSRRFLVAGGFGDSGGNHVRIDGVQILDLTSEMVVDLAHRPESELLGPRLHHTITPLSTDKFLVFGGRTSPAKPCSETLLLHLLPDDNGITHPKEYSLQTLDFEGSMSAFPDPRWRHTTTRLTVDAGRDVVLVCGGRGVDGQPLGDAWILDVSTLRWEKLEVDGLPWQPRHSHTATPWKDSSVVIACGMGADSTPLNSVVVFDVSQSTSSLLETQPLLCPRYSHTAHVTGDQLILVGGVNPQCDTPPSLTIIHLVTGAVQDVNIEMSAPPSPLMLHNHTSHYLEEEDSILIIGGGGNIFSFGTHLNQTPVMINRILRRCCNRRYLHHPRKAQKVARVT